MAFQTGCICFVGANLTDGVAVITGGSRGIGRATAIAAAARGFRVCVGYASNEVAAREVVATIEATGGTAVALKCDVGEEADILALFKAADQFGSLVAQVNNAAIVGDPDRAHRLSSSVPMRRVGTADEIANAIVWLMSDQASYVTGAILDVSGGR